MADVAEHKVAVHLVTPERELYSGEVDLLIARTTEGDVGIMANHAPLLAALAIGPLTLVDGGDRRRAAIDGGFLHVKGNRADVLAEFAELESEIDLAAAERRAERYRSKAEAGDAAAQAELAKAVVRIDLAKR